MLSDNNLRRANILQADSVLVKRSEKLEMKMICCKASERRSLDDITSQRESRVSVPERREQSKSGSVIAGGYVTALTSHGQ